MDMPSWSQRRDYLLSLMDRPPVHVMIPAKFDGEEYLSSLQGGVCLIDPPEGTGAHRAGLIRSALERSLPRGTDVGPIDRNQFTIIFPGDKNLLQKMTIKLKARRDKFELALFSLYNSYQVHTILNFLLNRIGFQLENYQFAIKGIRDDPYPLTYILRNLSDVLPLLGLRQPAKIWSEPEEGACFCSIRPQLRSQPPNFKCALRQC